MMTSIVQTLCSDRVRGNIDHWLHHLPVRRESPVLVEQEHFRLKLAETPSEVAAAQRLRYRVFKEEQGRLTTCSSGIDRDRFDPYCRHLLVQGRGHPGLPLVLQQVPTEPDAVVRALTVGRKHRRGRLHDGRETGHLHPVPAIVNVLQCVFHDSNFRMFLPLLPRPLGTSPSPGRLPVRA